MNMPIFNYEVASPKHLRLHRSQKKIRAVLGGNRAGKTRWGWQEVLWYLYGMHPYHLPFPPPIRIRICCVDENHGIKEIMLPYAEQLLPPGSWHYKAEPKTIDVAIGDGLTAHIKFLTYQMELDTFGGTSQHLIWMDEEPANRRQYVQNLMRTVDVGGRLMVTMTPLHGMTWAYDEIIEGNPQDVDWDTISIYDNKFLPKEEIDIIERNVDPDEKDAVLYGRFISPTGLVYKDFGTTHHILDAIDKIPPEWLVILGIDTHESIRNPQSCVFCAITQDNELVVFDEVTNTCLISEFAGMIMQKLGEWGVDYKFAVMDISQHSALVGIDHKAELVRYGVKKVQVADKSKGSPQEGRSKIKELLKYDDETGLKPALYVTENCQELIWQFRHYIYADWASNRMRDSRNPKEEVRKKDDHLLDALRYVVQRNIKWRPSNFQLPKPARDGKHLIRM